MKISLVERPSVAYRVQMLLSIITIQIISRSTLLLWVCFQVMICWSYIFFADWKGPISKRERSTHAHHFKNILNNRFDRLIRMDVRFSDRSIWSNCDLFSRGLLSCLISLSLFDLLFFRGEWLNSILSCNTSAPITFVSWAWVWATDYF